MKSFINDEYDEIEQYKPLTNDDILFIISRVPKLKKSNKYLNFRYLTIIENKDNLNNNALIVNY
jgi:hypothetical protein